MRGLGVAARTWDVADNERGDLTQRSVLAKLRGEVLQGRIAGAMLAPPCGSFGPAGNRRKPLRTAARPWGRAAAELTEHEQQRVKTGNATAKASLEILSWLNRVRTPWILEHPHGSYLWQTKQMQKVLAECEVFVVDQCRFGAKWRKRTRLACGNLEEQDVEIFKDKLRRGAKGCCSTTGWPHWILSGAEKGRDRTSLAAAYPSRLAAALARCLTSVLRSSIYNKPSGYKPSRGT